MKNLFLIFLLIPLFSLGQVGEDFYDLNKDKYYYDLLNEKNLKGNSDYKYDVQTVLETDKKRIIQSTGFYYYGGRKSYFDIYELNIIYNNSQGKVNGIAEERHFGEDTRITEAYISNAFNQLGNPKRKLNNQSVKLQDKNYYFESGYVWDILHEGKASEIYLGIILETKNTYKKNGKLKSSKTEKYQLRFYLPKGKTYTESELDFNKRSNESERIGAGFFKAYRNDYKNNSLFNDKLDTYDNELLHSYLFLPRDNDAPTDYIQLFKQLSVLLYEDIIWEEFLDVEPKITFTSLEGSTIAVARGMNNNCEIDILVDITKWNNASHSERIFIMFHELGHDVYNLKHSDGLRLMATTSYNVENKELLGEIIHEMFYYLNSKSGYLDIQCDNTTSSRIIVNNNSSQATINTQRTSQSSEVINYFERGNQRIEEENYQGAIEDFTVVIKNNPDDNNAYYNRGIAYYNLAEYTNARYDFNVFIVKSPEDSDGYVYRGLSKFYSDDKEGACKDWTKASNLGNEYSSDYLKDFCNIESNSISTQNETIDGVKISGIIKGSLLNGMGRAMKDLKALEGVSVSVVGKNNITKSNSSGFYSIVINPGDIIEFSHPNPNYRLIRLRVPDYENYINIEFFKEWTSAKDSKGNSLNDYKDYVN